MVVVDGRETIGGKLSEVRLNTRAAVQDSHFSAAAFVSRVITYIE